MLPFPFQMGGLGYAVSGISLPPIEFVGYTTAPANRTSSTNISLTSLTGGIDTAARENDVVVVAHYSAFLSSVVSSVSTAGYTNPNTVWNNTNNQGFIFSYYKRMTATPDTIVTVSPTTNANCAAFTVVMVFRNVSAVTPMDVASQKAFQDFAIPPNPPAVTPVTAGAVIIMMGGVTGAGASITGNFACSNAGTFYADKSLGSSLSIAMGAGFTFWTGGAFDPAAYTGVSGVTNPGWAAITLVLRPG